MYVACDPNRLRQGDIVKQLFFPQLGDAVFDFQALDQELAKPIKLSPLEGGDPPKNLAALVKVIKRPGMILSQGCDLERGDFVCVAPLFKLKGRFRIRRVNPDGSVAQVDWDKASPDELEQERKKLASQEQYLGVFPAFASAAFGIDVEAVVDFRHMTSFVLKESGVSSYLLANRLASLTHQGLSVLQHKLANFFGRYAADNNWHQVSTAAPGAAQPPPGSSGG